ncbi:hypothetical protein BRC65_00745 [Halobacteriales archaeon QH_2_65_14]|nr:MAG: hypothetical protein BRC65_00745 [Halobacteriales archaeon QH_2_65_14]
MSATGRPGADAPDASDVATRLRDAGFVRLVAGASGDAVAAAGLLASALGSLDVPYQSSVVPLPEPADRATDDDVTVALGRPSADADLTVGTGSTPASRTAFDVASRLAVPDAELALAGTCAAGVHPGEELLAAGSERGIERRPGVGIPTSNPVAGLAHSTLVHAAFSGSVEDAADAIGRLDVPDALADDDWRRVASLVAFTVTEEGTPRGATRVEGFLRPLASPGSRFETVEGYGDVLDAVAHERPGLAVPLALGALERETALDAWRRHASRAHEAVRAASAGRYDGLFVARCGADAPLGTVARLVRDYRSPEPLVLVVTDGAACVAATDDSPAASHHVGSMVAEAATSVGGDGTGTATRARARFDVEPTEFVVALREVL